ncbi:hypothetical protein ACFPRL_19855 [Pseudoclavibacter helvolus]
MENSGLVSPRPSSTRRLISALLGRNSSSRSSSSRSSSHVMRRLCEGSICAAFERELPRSTFCS